MTVIKTAVLLGLFDGVHTGHRMAVKTLMSVTAQRRIVYTFSSSELDTKGKRKLLCSDQEKRDMLLSLGADEVVFAPFSKVRNLTPEEFAQNVLLGELEASVVVCGEDFRFGAGACGDVSILKSLLKGKAELVTVPILHQNGKAVSTTRIRALLEEGRIKEANALLGCSYQIKGEVVHGAALGRQMGIRTVNTISDPERLIPADGVYSTTTIVDGREYKSVTNIGFKPTVSNNPVRGVETHILDFDLDIYSNTISIKFNDYYRKERKFTDLAELIEVINQDINKRKKEI